MIGKKIKGFKFESGQIGFHPSMLNYVGKIGIIETENLMRTGYIVKYDNDTTYSYPKELCKEHLIEDKVPSHYQTNNDFDVIDFCKLYNLNFNRGNIIKYVCRAGKKEDELKDLKKALDYLQREIKHYEK